MTTLSDRNNDLRQSNEKLAQSYYTGSRFNSIFLGVTGLGVIVIYFLAQYSLLGAPAPQLLYVAGDIFVFALLQIPVILLARNKRGPEASFLESFSILLFAAILPLFWEGIIFVSMGVALVAPLTAYVAGLHRKYYSWMIALVIGGIAGIIFINGRQFFVRLPSDSPAGIASLAFLATIGILLITVMIIARSRSYRNLRSQLLTSFVIIVTIPALLAAILSAVGAYVNNEAQVLNVLATIVNLKEDQINGTLASLKVDAVRVAKDRSFSNSIILLLTSDQSDPVTDGANRSTARARLLDFLSVERATYAEIMVLNVKGEVVVSTITDNIGKNYQSELFYRKGSIDDFVGFSNNPLFKDANLIFATPIYDQGGSIYRGILVFRANTTVLKNIVEVTPAFSEMETYLVEKRLDRTNEGEKISLVPLTKIRTLAPTYGTQELLSLLNSGKEEGKSTYQNYANISVLGYFKHLNFSDVYIIAEVPREYVLRSSIKSLLSSSGLAAFAILVAIAAIAISADSIATPISTLADIAANFAAGNLTARATIERRDEIGALSTTYNQMADQLQDIIGKLEQRVADRTKELEDQSLRLRISAEIARDAASSHNLSTLLDQAGSLILERFEVYHTGIFLIDANREYAVLVASPTEAGKQMLANNHKLRVGEVGIVGRVAFTGDSRISLDTGADAVYFNNPFLPKTRSEMALALKVENRIIGVLDVQSDQPQAFDEGDIAIMQILADQLATAIERTRLLEQVEKNLSDLEQAYGRFTREGWKTLGESGLLSKTGYKFDNIRIQSITEIPPLGDEAMMSGVMVTEDDQKSAEGATIAIPIKLRGQTIGVVSAGLKEGYTKNTVATLELAIERLALSLESARLYEEARLRADREQRIAQVTSNISSASEFDAILRTTVEEVGRILGDAEVSIQIISDSSG